MSEKLSTIESKELARHEGIISAGKTTFVNVGMSLTAIRECRLYRQDYSTFELYCQQRWGWSRQRAAQLIKTSAVAQQLPQDLSTMVDKERVAREVAKVPEARRSEVIKRAASKGKVTSKTVKDAASEVVEPDIQDCDGVPVPSGIVQLWLSGVSEVQGVLSDLSRIKSALRAAQEENDPLWRQVNFPAVIGDLEKAWTGIQVAKPHAVCPQCQGHPEVQECRLCLGSGIIGKFRYQAVPKELLDVRRKALGKTK